MLAEAGQEKLELLSPTPVTCGESVRQSAAEPEPGASVPEPSNDEILRVFQTRAETRAFYDKIAKVYDRLAERSEAPVRERGLELLNVRAGETVLEIGCGTGRSLLALAGRIGAEPGGGRVIGLDLSAGMLRQARRLLGDDGSSSGRAPVALVAADATRLPLAPDAVDAIFVSFTLELFDTPEIPVVLAECRRVLRPSGRMVVVGMSKESSGSGAMVKVFEWTHRHFPNFVDCRPIYVRRALEQAGFGIGEVDRMNMWVPVEVVLAAKI